MIMHQIFIALQKFTKSRQVHFIQENRKLLLQFILTIFFIALGTWFIKHEKAELGEVQSVLHQSNSAFLTLGIIVTAIYLILQGLIYKLSFKALHLNVSLYSTTLLYLKRNFISIFIPAGGVASLAFFTRDIEDKGIPKTKILFASTIYAFIGMLSVTLVAIPIFAYSMAEGFVGKGEWLALLTLAVPIGGLFLAFRSVMQKGRLFKTIAKYIPSAEVFMEDIGSHAISIKRLVLSISVSMLVDLCGIIHLYVAMRALNFDASLTIAMIGYLTGVISLSLSPFMRGLGAVEISMAYILGHFGYSNVQAIAITFLYRFFEFWLPMMTGAVSFLIKINKLLLRIVPAFLIMALGIVNIVSVLTPAIKERVAYLLNFLPVDALAISDMAVFAFGILMLSTAAFMLKGLRQAWWIALILSILSFIGHLTKAIDYEEALLAVAVIAALLYSRKEYYIKGNPRFQFVGMLTAGASILAVIVYGAVGFYLLDKKHFGINFDLGHSILYSIQNFFLVGSNALVPQDRFARTFLVSINVSGALSIAFLVYTFIKPYVIKMADMPETWQKANETVLRHGTSALDYFKTYNDKMLFMPDDTDALISYKVAGNFAVVLESPVAIDHEQKKNCIAAFDNYCYNNGLKAIYYRTPENELAIFKSLKKKVLFVGQEGIVDLDVFNLEGSKRRSLRNSVYKVVDKGYKATIHQPPIKDGLLQKLQAVSNEWLKSNKRDEIVFSQGMFVWDELKQQTILTVENNEEKVVGFVNIVPDHCPNEATYDLMRKTTDAPGGVMDFMLIELFKHIKANGILHVNIGFAPLSGIESPQNLTEKSMRFAYNKIQALSHYKGMREYKEKFATIWQNKYLVYDNDFDLLQIPGILSKVIKPD
jgi:phosphatidylglycerol lysyltransferase